ncbi:hypothetical protein [Clostridium thermobutyricum]|uniref:hypothetical protein n=1 Tax=Clostridium thermobutyricum TaxID=29372 RepID=UPI002943A6F3|nr:hypothetical protein [Clostridium thermobutyricum]
MTYEFKIPKDIGQFDVKIIEDEYFDIPKNIENIKEILEKNKIDIIKEDVGDIDSDENLFFNKMSFIVTMIAVCPPVGLVLMYAYGKNTVKNKIIVTILILIIDIILLCLIVYFLRKFIN